MDTRSTETLPDGWHWVVVESTIFHCAYLHSPEDCKAAEITKTINFGGHETFYIHTWDEDGCGGENSTFDSLQKAMQFAEAAIHRQGFHMKCDLNCSDHGDEEVAAEIAGEAVSTLDQKGQEVVREVVKAMLGPKRYREWVREYNALS